MDNIKIPNFLDRSSFILGEEGYRKLNDPTISIAGLGGVGGLAFLTLVRSGIRKFRLAEDGIFDPPDMNRQALAYNKTMDLRKLDVYAKYALDINPDLQIQQYSDGLTLGNIDSFIKDSDIFIRAIDWQKNADVKRRSIELISKYEIPMFQALTVGTSSVLHNYKPGGMTPKEFWPLYKNPKVLPYLHTKGVEKKVNECYKKGIVPSICTGATIASLLLASEVLVYLLQGTDLVERDVIYTPRFVIFNSFRMEMYILDGTKL